jgi:alpha-tubulin suppressor-like RCC1 family protein
VLRTTTLRRYASMTALAMALSITGATMPAAAAAKPATQVKAVVTPATVLVGGTIAVTGSLSPKTATAVLLQRLDGKKWSTVAHAKPSKTGTYALNLHAPKKPVALTLRVTRAVSATAKAGVSATLHVRVVKTAFHVSAQPGAASLTTAQPVVVSGKVSPKAKGSVSLDSKVGSRWVSLAKTTLAAGSTYAFSKALPAGSYTLRVSKPLTTTVAGGVSKAVTEVVHAVTPPTAPPTTPGIVLPVVTTTTLTGVTVGTAFRQTLAATSGTAPYTWSVAGGSLPTGLSLLPSGDVFGTPLSVATFSFTVRATDALGHSGTGSITAIVDAVAVRAWGYGAMGEYGNSTTTSTLAIATASLPGNVKAITGGDHFTLALMADGTVYSWGDNSSGQLGLGDLNPRTTPTQITTLSHVTTISAGENAAYAVTTSGALYAWGDNTAGEQDNGSASAGSPVEMPMATPLTNVVSVAAGDGFALALIGNGAVMAFGNGMQGVLGNNTNTAQQTTAVRAMISTPDQVNVVAITASSTAGYALLSDGTVQAWGRQERGQLGNGTPTGTFQLTPVLVAGLSGVTALSCTGFEFCLALRSDRSVVAWGYGADGEMGEGHTLPDNLTPTLVPGLTDITAVATGHQTGYALHADGTVSSWGFNSANETGNGDATHTIVSTAAKIPGLTGVVGLAAGSHDGYAMQAQ